MSIATFTVTPPAMLDRHAIESMKKNRRMCSCWLCGASVDIRRWGTHVDRHRAEGWVPRPPAKSTRPAAEIFAEWQQRDATPEELAEWD